MVEKCGKKCSSCGKIHGTDLTDEACSFVDQFFSQVWKQGKNDLKEMSKKQVAEQMYYLGVKHIMELTHHNLQKIKKDMGE